MKKILILIASITLIPALVTAGPVKFFNCNQSYFNGCVDIENKGKDDIIKKENPYKKLLPKKLPLGFQLDNKSYPIYASPEAPVEFREMLKNPTDENIKAYLNASKYREAKIKFLNSRMEEVEKLTEREKVAEVEKSRVNISKDIVMSLFLNIASSEYEKSEDMVKAAAELKKIFNLRVNYYFVDSYRSDFKKMALRGEKSKYANARSFANLYNLKSTKMIQGSLAESKLGLTKFPAIVVENKKSRIAARIYKGDKNAVLETIKDFIIKSKPKEGKRKLWKK